MFGLSHAAFFFTIRIVTPVTIQWFGSLPFTTDRVPVTEPNPILDPDSIDEAYASQTCSPTMIFLDGFMRDPLLTS